MPENRTIEDVAKDLKDAAALLDALAEEAKNMKHEVRLWTENQPNGKHIRMKIMNLQPVAEL